MYSNSESSHNITDEVWRRPFLYSSPTLPHLISPIREKRYGEGSAADRTCEGCLVFISILVLHICSFLTTCYRCLSILFPLAILPSLPPPPPASPPPPTPTSPHLPPPNTFPHHLLFKKNYTALNQTMGAWNNNKLRWPHFFAIVGVCSNLLLATV